MIISKKAAAAGAIAACAVIFLMLGPFYIVKEGEQAVVTRFGKLVNTRTAAGLYLKVPVMDVVTAYPKRILSLDGDNEAAPTKENLYVIVDTTSRWRISDPKQFYQAFTSVHTAGVRLNDIIDSSVRMVIAQNSLAEIVRSSDLIIQQAGQAVPDEDGFSDATAISERVTKGRRQLSLEMRDKVRESTGDFGIELIDVVPRQIKYAEGLTESVYNRMIKERNQVAQRNRSRGEGNKADWLGRLENDLLRIQSEAYRESEEIRGKADAEASAIYAEAYRRDPEFYAFWKSMDSYQTTMPKFDATYSSNMEYFNYLYSPSGKR
ncbi:protease modulator HflC [Treponema endosymbiont of Eucomonympha sp.]|jgi:membrane protease subunit HflC|uniref:protease modulator HflC n=1 Tax=Treponema endosymbiont of Eucomonympha sp. TaxID=1580831 RepID=UPI0007515DE3|nr:protease modulator HflC [Treponema endosymbiont of Eucomonympha sp.]